MDLAVFSILALRDFNRDYNTKVINWIIEVISTTIEISVEDYHRIQAAINTANEAPTFEADDTLQSIKKLYAASHCPHTTLNCSEGNVQSISL